MSAGKAQPQMHPIGPFPQTLLASIRPRDRRLILIKMGASLCHDFPQQTNDLTLLLPTAAQRFVELNQRQQFISSGLRQPQLRVEKVAISIERVEQAVDAALISQISQTRSVLQGRHQQLLLGANLFYLT